ncbi:MAG: HD domain-containing protein [Gammaproteobacteria bacterium]|nr:HD domain-containing protein [Gammaproteobacteria bacterium]
MIQNTPVNLIDLVISTSNAIDLVSHDVANHHKRVAFIALSIAREMGLSSTSRRDLLYAALLHDIGALNLKERLNALEAWEGTAHDTHAEAAYLLLSKFRHFKKVAEIVRYHHTPWEHAVTVADDSISIESCILHLADRIDSLIKMDRPILGQATHISSTISRRSGSNFMPELTEVFSELAWKESFWLQLMDPQLEQQLSEEGWVSRVELDWDDLQDFSEIIAQLIDFRSRFTATHSSGVSTVAAIIANLVGFSEYECAKMKVAGYLHDVGKLAIPSEILEKPASLNSEEFQTIKSHAYYTHRILSSVTGLEDITAWASMHHERLDGQGYPFRQPGNTIPLGARIMAVADVFTALSETRPYREKSSREELLLEFEKLVRLRQIDGGIAAILMEHYDDIERHRELSQRNATEAYDEYLTALEGYQRNAMRRNVSFMPSMTAII